jgi:hypothetical protein
MMQVTVKAEIEVAIETALETPGAGLPPTHPLGMITGSII